MSSITLALSKGRIFEETLPLLAAAGIVPADNPESSRKLIIGTNRPEVRLVIVRATDTPTYVQYGAADLGIAGKDVLLEHGGAGLYQPLDLNIARCRMCVAVQKGFNYAVATRPGGRIRVATKYHHLTRSFFRGHGVADYQLVDSQGATEGAVKNLTAEAIADITTTGSTLRDNHLRVLADGLILRSQATLFASRSASWDGPPEAALATLCARAGLPRQVVRLRRGHGPRARGARRAPHGRRPHDRFERASRRRALVVGGPRARRGPGVARARPAAVDSARARPGRAAGGAPRSSSRSSARLARARAPWSTPWSPAWSPGSRPRVARSAGAAAANGSGRRW